MNKCRTHFFQRKVDEIVNVNTCVLQSNAVYERPERNLYNLPLLCTTKTVRNRRGNCVFRTRTRNRTPMASDLSRWVPFSPVPLCMVMLMFPTGRIFGRIYEVQESLRPLKTQVVMSE